jgi:hypothetical protein
MQLLEVSAATVAWVLACVQTVTELTEYYTGDPGLEVTMTALSFLGAIGAWYHVARGRGLGVVGIGVAAAVFGFVAWFSLGVLYLLPAGLLMMSLIIALFVVDTPQEPDGRSCR